MSLPDPDRDAQFYEDVPMRRLIAFMFDAVIIVVLMGLVLVAAMIVGLLTFGLGWFLGIALFTVTGFLYRLALMANNSATLGMSFMGIEIRDRTGEPLDLPTAMVHTIGYYVTVLFPVLMIAGWIIMLMSPHKRLMHDWLPGTAAINRPI
ncbi:MAG: RDD family protein [Pseudomonadota bacterium]